MSATPAQRVRELFDAALDVAPDARAAHLRANFPGEDAAIADALDLLAYADPERADALAPRVVAVARDLMAPGECSPLGRRIGAWQVMEEIGQGGMGTVYRVERRDADYTQVAALKLIRGFPTRESVARFRRERRLLATLEHPGIARLVDGGTTEEGQPYLVMSLVEGVPLGEWVRLENPSPQRIARLVQSLCLAVHHAHQHLIVHRDLKPGNVLVGADDRPTLLDFGIAKLLADTGDEALSVAKVMTPAYASPEQRAGGEATTASDVFGLGLILAELLRNGTPTSADTDPAQGLPPGDLGNVARMALRTEPQRRYPSASAMADDIDRYFSGRALVAAPDTLRYRARKFIARHRSAVAAIFVLIVLSVAFTWRLLQERDRARQEAAVATEVTRYLRDLFKQADPATALGRTYSARDILEQGERQLDENAIPDARVRARLRATIGEIYVSIGDPGRSAESLQEAVRLMREDPAIDPGTLGRTLHDLAQSHQIGGKPAPAEPFIREALSLRERAHGAQSPEVAASLSQLGVILQNQIRFDEAEAAYLRALEILESSGVENSDELAAALHNLGWLAVQTARPRDALPWLERSMALKRARLDPDHPRVLNTLQILTQAHVALGDLERARVELVELLERRRRVYGEDSVMTLRAYNEVASVLQDLGQYTQARPHYDAANAIARHLVPGDSIDLATGLSNRATLDEQRGALVDAERGYRDALAMRVRLLGETHLAVARVRHHLARLLLDRGEIAEAARLAGQAMEVRAARNPADHPERHDSEVLLARIAITRGDVEDARQQLATLEPYARAPTTNPLRAARWHAAYADLAQLRGDLAAAERARTEQIEVLGRLLASDHPIIALAQLTRARAAQQRGDELAARTIAAAARAPIEAEIVAAAPARAELDRLLVTQ